MQVKKNKKSQAQRLSEALLAIKKDVTAADRKAAEHICTKATISKYLNGVVMDIDTGLKLLTFFKNRISKREKALA